MRGKVHHNLTASEYEVEAAKVEIACDGGNGTSDGKWNDDNGDEI